MNDTAFEAGVMSITNKFVDIIITPISWLITGAALIMFFYGLAMFIFNSETSEKEAGRNHMIWGMVGLLIIFAVWGIITFVGDTVNSLR